MHDFLQILLVKPESATALNTAKNHLKKHGWTQDQAAKHFNVTTSYLCRVLNGHLSSRRLVQRILELGRNPKPSKKPFYVAPERRAA